MIPASRLQFQREAASLKAYLHCSVVITFSFALLMFLSMAAVAQTKGPKDSATTGAKNVSDPAIVAALKEISAARIQANDEKLVSFYNRSTLSAANPAAMSGGRGIGAAREWIKSEFERYSKACGGC